MPDMASAMLPRKPLLVPRDKLPVLVADVPLATRPLSVTATLVAATTVTSPSRKLPTRATVVDAVPDATASPAPARPTLASR